MTDVLPDLSALEYHDSNVIDESSSLQDATAVNLVSEPTITPDVDDSATEATEKKKFELRLILSLYLVKFPEELKAFKDEGLDTMALKQLEDLRSKFDFILGAAGASETQKKTLNALIFVAESSLVAAGVPVDGACSMLLRDTDFQRDLMRLSLKYLSASQTAVELTVPLRVMSAFSQAYANNTLERSAAVAGQPETSHQTLKSNQPPRGEQQAAPSTTSTSLASLNERYQDL